MNDVDELINFLEQLALDNYDRKNNITFKELQQSAKIFLDGLKMLSQYKDYIIQIEREKYNRDRKNFAESINLNQNKEVNETNFIYRQKYRLAFYFDEQLNKYLDKLPKSVIVVTYQNGQLKSYEITHQQLVHFTQFCDKKYFRLKFSLKNKVCGLLNKFTKGYVVEENFDYKYVSVLQDIYNETISEGNYDNHGKIKEAYINALFNGNIKNKNEFIDLFR